MKLNSIAPNPALQVHFQDKGEVYLTLAFAHFCVDDKNCLGHSLRTERVACVRGVI